MNNSHWRTSLGGAVSITGTSLIGIGVITTQMSVPTKLIVGITVAGFILSGIGKGLTALFAADAGTVNNIAAAVDQINQQGASPLAAPSTDKPPMPTP